MSDPKMSAVYGALLDILICGGCAAVVVIWPGLAAEMAVLVAVFALAEIIRCHLRSAR